MKLLSSTTSPFVRKARIVILEKSLTDKVEEVFIKTSALNPNSELMASNPLARIPCLISDEGESIFDSRVICHYLDYEGHGQGATLHPSGNVRHKTFIALMDGALDSAVAMIYEKLLRPVEFQYEPMVEAHWLKVKNAIEYVDQEWMSMLDRMNMATIGAICLLEYLDFRFPDRDWRKGAPNLAQWHDEIKDRESFVATRPRDA